MATKRAKHRLRQRRDLRQRRLSRWVDPEYLISTAEYERKKARLQWQTRWINRALCSLQVAVTLGFFGMIGYFIWTKGGAG